MTRDEAIKLVRDKKCPTSRLEAEEWVEVFEALGMFKPEEKPAETSAYRSTEGE